MKNKKIVFICPSYPAIGGVEAVTSLLVDYFLGKEYEISILVSSTEKMLGATLDKHFEWMTPMLNPPNGKNNLTFIDDFIRSKDIACVFNQGIFSDVYLHSNLHPDVLFFNILHSCPFWEVEKFKHSTLRQLLHSETKLLNRFKILVRFILNRYKPGMSHPSIESHYRQQISSVSKYVVLDPAYKKNLEERLYHGVVQDKIVSIPNPLVIPGQPVLTKRNQVLWVGRLIYEPKRVDRLFRIWKSIQEEVPEWELLILGDGEERASLEKMAVNMQLNNCYFLGYRNTTSFYESASILCLTSTYEGFPVVLLEAQGYGTVPISFGCVEAIHTIIDHRVNGIVVEPFDEECFAYELLKLMKEDTLRNTMSEKAKEKASAFDIEIIGDRWLKLMGEL